MKLYEISRELDDFLQLLEAGEIPAEAVDDTLEGLHGEFAEKLDDVAAAYKGLLAEAEAIKAEREKLYRRQLAKAAAADRLKQYIDSCMKMAAGIGKKPAKLETARSVLSYRKSERIVITDEIKTTEAAKAAPADMGLLIYREPEIDKTALKKAIKSGYRIEGAELQENLNLQIK